MIKNEDIKITSQMLSIISEIDEFKLTWKFMDKMSVEKIKKLRRVATIESVGSSNRIEGNKLSDIEIENLLSSLGKESFKSRDEEEAIGYARLMDTIYDDYEVIPLTENYIKQLHKILLQYSLKDQRHKGEYKKVSNSVVAYSEDGKEIGVVFETATPFDTPFRMEELTNWTRKALQDKFIHPLLVIGVFIVEFLAIHPFEDGNGRLSRALTSLLLLKTGYMYVPYSSMEAVIEDNKEGYYRALRQTQQTLNNDKVDLEPWLIFFLKTLQKQKVRLEYKLSHNVDTYSFDNLTELEARILSFFERESSATLDKIIKYTEENRNTIKKALQRLVKNNILILHKRGRASWYSLLNKSVSNYNLKR